MTLANTFLLAAMPLSLPQFIISIPLFFVLLFGIGFILNMILKTTWLPGVIYAVIIVVLLFRLHEYHWVDLTVLLVGLLGAFGSGWTIQTLRTKGYRMF
ncbi:Putative membrane protein [Seinonella peptonophila]|uniref:Putative membrane protein n=1 Tax=Seinonella peptonophila TaxID=112248 RepID=A0A1M4WJH3_9BACL|nr:YuiB family protein [Seinonella peptonophila]SHE81223.1 Putative membrane protein [Seinonella peptonophila]